MVKNEQGLMDHGTLKLGLSCKGFDEMSRLISDGIIFGFMTNLLCIFNI